MARNSNSAATGYYVMNLRKKWPDNITMYSTLDVPDSGHQPFTEYSRWRLLVNDGGRHTWHYLKTDDECEKWPQNTVDKFWLGMPVVCPHVFPNSLSRLANSEPPRITTGQRSSLCRSKWILFLQTSPIPRRTLARRIWGPYVPITWIGDRLIRLRDDIY